MSEITYKTESVYTLRISESEFSYLQSALWNYQTSARDNGYGQTVIDEIDALAKFIDDGEA